MHTLQHKVLRPAPTPKIMLLILESVRGQQEKDDENMRKIESM